LLLFDRSPLRQPICDLHYRVIRIQIFDPQATVAQHPLLNPLRPVVMPIKRLVATRTTLALPLTELLVIARW
jgi:hypothetical protein